MNKRATCDILYRYDIFHGAKHIRFQPLNIPHERQKWYGVKYSIKKYALILFFPGTFMNIRDFHMG